METTSFHGQESISRLRLFFALSRTPHTLLDISTPALCALLWMGTALPLEVVVLGLITAFSGYTTVYALNDVIDYRVDQEKMQGAGLRDGKTDLDSVYVRHPMAQGMLSYREGIFWTVAWAFLTLIGSYILNPLCTIIFLMASLLEAVYCLLLRITYLRGIISGIVKNSGGIAAVFAVDPDPAPLFVLVIFLWLFFWEIGGQNVPNDWGDMEEDRRLQAQTIPVHLGPQGAIMIILSSLVMALGMSLVLFWISPKSLGFFYIIGALSSGFYFLLLPAYRLHKKRAPEEAFHLFNRASYYPPAMLVVTILSLVV